MIPTVTSIGRIVGCAVHERGFVFKVKVDGLVYSYGCFIAAENPMVVRIGQEKLADLVFACGMIQCRDSDELLGKHLWVQMRDLDGRLEIKNVAPIAPPTSWHARSDFFRRELDAPTSASRSLWLRLFDSLGILR